MESIKDLWDQSKLEPMVKKMFDLSKAELDPQSIFIKQSEEEVIIE